MSEVKVDTISERTAAGGVTIDGVLIKDSIVNTDNIAEKTATAGVTIDGVLLKDGSLKITTGAGADKVLTSDAAGDATWEAAAAGGITHASQWRLTTDFTSSALPISSNLEEVDAPAGFGVIGASMTESSGIFTFPATGYWWVRFTASWYTTGATNANWAIINTSTDGYTSNANVAENSLGTWADPHYVSCSVDYIMDVTNTATHQIRFGVTVGSGFTTRGDSNISETSMTFIRLADT